MSPDIVLVPCWIRPELLWHCLDNLRNARGINDCHIWICEDYHVNGPSSPEIRDVVEDRLHGLSFLIHAPAPHEYWGNNHNVLQSYERALHTDAQYVYLVEEDVMVAEDFLEWHRVVQERELPFCSIAVRHMDVHPPAEIAADPRYFFPMNHYASLGVCWRRQWLAMLHPWFNNPTYLQERERYLDVEFPNSRFKGGNGAQDGIICRIMERHGLRGIYPTRPRAFHAGWYGYNRSMDPQPKGTLAERIKAVGRSLADAEFMAAQVADCQPCDLKAAPWDGSLIEWQRR